MGTNFYWLTNFPADVTLPTGVITQVTYDDMDPLFHIGKRSAAGMYCWRCHVTLCKGGSASIHTGRSQWYDRCPQCGMLPVNEGFKSGPAALELGFAKPRSKVPDDVRGASSFVWAQEPDIVRALCQQNSDKLLIVDEYGRELTGKTFLDMLASNCPIEFTDSIGKSFC